MSDEEIKIAIAEICGFTEIVVGAEDIYGRRLLSCWSHTGQDRIPNYAGDLNAMREAEKVLTDAQHVTFRVALLKGHDDHRKQVSATAAQRAIAFLRTLNIYKDTP